MLRVEENLDMERLEVLRKEVFGEGLDEKDNLSWHIALRDGDRFLGAARLYREGDSLRLDRVAIAPSAGESAGHFYEMLFRTLMLKCTVLNPEWVSAVREREDGFYEKFGFEKREDGLFWARPGALKFPKLCKECEKC